MLSDERPKRRLVGAIGLRLLIKQMAMNINGKSWVEKEVNVLSRIINGFFIEVNIHSKI